VKPVPITRKGCKNAGWIWDVHHLNKVVVPLHPGKPFTYITNTFNYKFMTKKGMYSLGNEPFSQGLTLSAQPVDIQALLRQVKPVKPRPWWQVWRRK